MDLRVSIAMIGLAIHLAVPCCSQTVREVEISGDGLRGRLLDNVANAKRQGGGFHPLVLARFPDSNLFRDDAVGLNFEHVFNGVAEDREISMFTPRRDACEIHRLGSASAVLVWPAESSSWGLECRMTYSIAAPRAVDMVFEATPTRDVFGQGYAAMMWASYINRARDRRIHFWGAVDGQEGWATFGDDTSEGFEVGTVSFEGVPDLPYEEGSQTLNLIENARKKFSKPFYYGLLDGDHDLATSDDTLAYIMMFDRAEPIRFAMWNFFKNESGEADTHSPAWDWQFVIRDPKVGQRYSCRARLSVQPFVDRETILEEYETWAASLR